jgi:hypothetical protein
MSALLQTWPVSGSSQDAHHRIFISNNASAAKEISS